MAYRDGETGYVPPQKRERRPTRMEWVAVGLAIGAAAVLFATTASGRAFLHVRTEQTAMLRSLSGASICACFVVLSLSQREPVGAGTRDHRRFLPFILLAIIVASLLAAGTIAFG